MRHLLSDDSNALINVNVADIGVRGTSYSKYRAIYDSSCSTESGRFTVRSMADVDCNSSSDIDPYSVAIRRLHLAVLPRRLPCREKETQALMDTLRAVICGNLNCFPFYISGLPGTGKTATVLSCIDALLDEATDGKLPLFEFVEINCLRLHSPADACKLNISYE